LNVLTGATGLLGSHIAEQLAGRGERVRALVRPASDTTFLRGLGAELVEGDLSTTRGAGAPASLRRAVAGADVVYHCAAKVGDWGARRDFQALIVDATASLLEACRQESVGRVLYVSSISVYGHPRPRPGERFTEDEPLGQNLSRWERYARAKIRAEEVCRAYPGPLTIIRPSWIYGPRDRNTLPRIIKALHAGRVRVVGSGDNFLNIIYAGDVAAGAIRAANAAAAGRAYNFSSEGEVTQRGLLDMLTDALGRPRVVKHIRFRTAYWLGLLSEVIGRVIRLKRPPHITRYAVGLIARPTLFSTARARAELDWRPEVGVAEGLRRTLEWYHQESGVRSQERGAKPARRASEGTLG
jgi:nucleoside-diphosphate-sugar epimerase